MVKEFDFKEIKPKFIFNIAIGKDLLLAKIEDGHIIDIMLAKLTIRPQGDETLICFEASNTITINDTQYLILLDLDNYTHYALSEGL